MENKSPAVFWCNHSALTSKRVSLITTVAINSRLLMCCMCFFFHLTSVTYACLYTLANRKKRVSSHKTRERKKETAAKHHSLSFPSLISLRSLHESFSMDSLLSHSEIQIWQPNPLASTLVLLLAIMNLSSYERHRDLKQKAWDWKEEEVERCWCLEWRSSSHADTSDDDDDDDAVCFCWPWNDA